MGTADTRKSRRTFWKAVLLLEKPYHFSAGTAISWLSTAVSWLGQANTLMYQSISGAYIMNRRGGAARAGTFRKVSFTFTNISANALYKGISANPHPEFAFTYLSPIFHLSFTTSGWRLGEGSVKAMWNVRSPPCPLETPVNPYLQGLLASEVKVKDSF